MQLTMTKEEYSSRHNNDGTAWITAFCFIGAVICIILGLIL